MIDDQQAVEIARRHLSRPDSQAGVVPVDGGYVVEFGDDEHFAALAVYVDASTGEPRSMGATETLSVLGGEGPANRWPAWWDGKDHPDIPFDKRWHPNHPENIPAPWQG